MNLKEMFDKFVDYVDEHRKNIIAICLSFLGFLVLLIVFFISGDEFSVSDEANILLENIEKRNYSSALENYYKWEKDFSESKMKRLNDSLTAKINKLILDKGDDYLNGKLSKEGFIGLVNTINSLTDIQLDLKRIGEQSKRVYELYLGEVIDYEKAISYANTISSLYGANNYVQEYKDLINEISESRKVYEIALKNQKLHKYHEAVDSYNKVSPKDKKYYELANSKKEECINEMYNFYIEKAEDENKNGNYEQAIQYILYLKNYYKDDETLTKLEEKYKKNMSIYSLTSDDILDLISSKMNEEKQNLSIEYFQQMINNDKYYYVEVYKFGELIDEVLVDAKNKKLFSYKDFNKNYKKDYADGFFRILENGEIQFAISDTEAQFVVERYLMKEEESYKSAEILPHDKLYKYLDINIDVNEVLNNQTYLYNFVLVQKGLFKKKDIYAVNIYTKQIQKLN